MPVSEMRLQAAILWLLVLSVMLAPPGSAIAIAEEGLPQSVRSLQIGDYLDLTAGNLHSFASEDGTDYVWVDPEDNLAVNVDIDKLQYIVRLAWHTVESSQQGAQTVANQFREQYLEFLVDEGEEEFGLFQVYEDAEVMLIIRVEGNMITREVIDQDSGVEPTLI